MRAGSGAHIQSHSITFNLDAHVRLRATCAVRAGGTSSGTRLKMLLFVLVLDVPASYGSAALDALRSSPPSGEGWMMRKATPGGHGILFSATQGAGSQHTQPRRLPRAPGARASDAGGSVPVPVPVRG
jgi:hypothetical protein